ncbi:hypothetical protein ACVIGB_001054 [Bradyrhizobium sp. USDA 4341]
MAKNNRYGYEPYFDEVGTRIRLVEGGGIPFRIAQLAAIEEVRGVMGDIAESDLSGRLKENPDMMEDLEKRAEELEAMKETDVGGQPLVLSEEQSKVLKALEKQGEVSGFIDLGNDRTFFSEQVQIYLQGGPIEYDKIIEFADDEGHETFLRELGVQSAMTP